MSYALIAGYDDDTKENCPKTEVIHVNGSTKICRSTADYPESVYGISGGSFLKNNLIVICGGERQSGFGENRMLF